MKTLVLFSLFLMISLPISAKLHTYDVYGASSEKFSYSDVCRHFKKLASIMEPANADQLECMGERVSIKDFCESKFKDDRQYARAYFNKEKKVVCQKAKRIVLKYSCAKGSNSIFCKNKIHGCNNIKNILAHNLKTVHQSLTGKRDGKFLNCYFDHQMAINQN